MRPIVRRYGDRALLVDLGSVDSAHRMASAVESAITADGLAREIAGVVVGFGNVVVLLDQPDGPDGSLTSWVEQVVLHLRDDPTVTAAGAERIGKGGPRVVEIPVVFDGPDLHEVAAAIGTGESGVVELLTGAELEVAFLGFSPGFPYLTGLPPELAAIRRRDTPRPSVRAGSVAVAGGFASVYPRATPGGWMVVGATTVPLFDPGRPPYALVRAGDKVRFRHLRPPTEAGPPSASGGVVGEVGSRPPLQARGGRWVEVVDPGLLSLVQDEGRRGVAGVGVPGAGAADPDALLLANRLVGNPDGAAAIELTVVGPTLRFATDAHVAVVGSTGGAVDVELDGRPCPDSTVVPVAPGQVLAIGRIRAGLRACLAVAGGFETPPVMGSRSSDLLSGLGPGPLMVGDQLGLGAPVRPHGSLVDVGRGASPGSPREVRVLAGPHHADDRTWRQLLGDRWTVGDASNRIGVRLVGAGGPLHDEAPASDLSVTAPTGFASTGMITGAIQLPPDGRPIILLPDHATVGGYPVIGCVIAADLAAVGQLAPGDPLTFTEVDLAAAQRAWKERVRLLNGRVRGWFPTAAGT